MVGEVCVRREQLALGASETLRVSMFTFDYDLFARNPIICSIYPKGSLYV